MSADRERGEVQNFVGIHPSRLEDDQQKGVPKPFKVASGGGKS